jgi:hypothetical protein
VRGSDRDGPLHVRVRRHDDVRTQPLGVVDEHLLQCAHGGVEPRAGAHCPEARRSRDLIVSAPPRVELGRDRANLVVEQTVDERVHVLVARVGLTVFVGYLVVVVLMGFFLDSVSIMLIVLPFVIPVFDGLGINLIWLGLITVIAIEIGLLTPPLGIAVYVVKANLDDQRMPVWQIFMGTMPMTLTMVVVLALCVLFPQLALWVVGVNWSWW